MRVLLIGDSLRLSTGFGRVLFQTAKAFVAAGHEVGQIACLEQPPEMDARPFLDLGVRPFFPGPDVVGFGVLAEVLQRFEPAVILFVGDAGTIWHWLRRLKALEYKGRTAVYAPVEGAPICPQYLDTYASADAAATMTRWSAERIAEATSGRLQLPAILHGVDTDAFRPLEANERAGVRDALGWGDDFVVSYVARNAGRKAHDRLIRAMGLLRAEGIKGIRIYLHCQPFDQYRLQGWNLTWLAREYGVADLVMFPSEGNALTGEPEMSLARKLAASDLYCHPAQVEGFGLPILEAMACGVPVAVTSDKGNMEEVATNAAFCWLRPSDWLVNFNGALHAVVDVEDIATGICEAREHPDWCARAAREGLERVAEQEVRWGTMTDQLLALVEESMEREREHTADWVVGPAAV